MIGLPTFDLFWYLSTPGWPEPNLILLNNALTQSGWNDETLTHENWRAIIRRRLSQLNWTRILTDVQPFLLEPDNINLLTLEHFDNLLNRSNVS